MLVRTLQEGDPAEPDLFTVEGRVGDRFLVCSDGVTAVLDDDEIHEVLADVVEPADAVDRLIALANEGGGPDNIVRGRRRRRRHRVGRRRVPLGAAAEASATS